MAAVNIFLRETIILIQKDINRKNILLPDDKLQHLSFSHNVADYFPLMTPFIAVHTASLKIQPLMSPRIWQDNFYYYEDLKLVHTHTRLTALSPGLPGWAGARKVKPIWILLKQETVSGSGISWAICQSALHSRQIATTAPHHSVFTLLATQPTASKHWMQPSPGSQ